MTQDKELENIRTSANIVDIISSYIPLTQKGKNYFGICPFHEDHSPSMSVSEARQIYKCFSCGAAGNVFTFVKDYENVSFMEAVKIVADKCGLVFRGNIKKDKKPQNYKSQYEIMDIALKFYQNNLNTKEGIKAKNYLNKRALDEEVIKTFEIGLALDYKHSLSPILLNKNYPADMLLSLGLTSENNDYKNDIFYNRIMFPIQDLEGNTVGFTGRIYEEAPNQAKYINSKESPIFKKGNILFNYHRAKNEIKRKKEVIIVEGNMDAIRMYASGIKNVVALMGTSLTDEQVSIIKSLRSKVILLFDNDNAGEIATYQNGNILEKSGIDPYVIRLSGEKDPDEYIIKNGVEAIINNIRSPISFLDFKLKYIKRNKDLTKTDDLIKYIKELILNIKDIKDDLTKEVIIKRVSDECEISYELLKTELDKVSNKNVPIVEKKLEKKVISKYDKAAENIIFFMLNDAKYIIRFQKEIGYFSKKKYRDLTNEVIYYYELNKNIDMASFITFVGPKPIYDDFMELIKNNRLEELTMQAFEEFIKVLQHEENKKEIDELKKQIAEEYDASKKIKLANKIIELKKGCVGNE